MSKKSLKKICKKFAYMKIGCIFVWHCRQMQVFMFKQGGG